MDLISNSRRFPESIKENSKKENLYKNSVRHDKSSFILYSIRSYRA
jgi:hypothetical protein